MSQSYRDSSPFNLRIFQFVFSSWNKNPDSLSKPSHLQLDFQLETGFAEAADALSSNNRVKVAAIDCTMNESVCGQYEVQGYPTLKYFYAGKEVQDYQEPRTKDAVVQFLTSKSVKTEL